METHLRSSKSVKLAGLAIISGICLWLSLSYSHHENTQESQNKASTKPADISSVPPQAGHQK